jgi:DNA-binding NarL/FixJ family response regulator
MPSGTRGRLKVLIVEDVFLIADMLDELLKEQGIEVIGPVSHLERGLDLALRAQIDGAILDVNLAGELCFPIAAALSQRGIPYFFITGYSGDLFPPQYQGIPRLPKPFGVADLMEIVARELRGGMRTAPSLPALASTG